MTGEVGQSRLPVMRLPTSLAGARFSMAVHFANFNSDDLVSPAGHARALMLERTEGLRLMPTRA